ncbi:hypothetical protein LOK49_LG01G03681 [Camellia lanceoleosa]|uniref:Uncharacterized protein n=1 Tax=Camellia lanceoleosa TaxID=1840588 RepID=A0ACC0J6V8_9ERIC|nr:hypothetical protein LOK49_LG01G03681 [Camellia lanceoleosa]
MRIYESESNDVRKRIQYFELNSPSKSGRNGCISSIAWWQPPSSRKNSNRKRKLLYRGKWLYKSRTVIYSSMEDSSDTFTDVHDGDGDPSVRSEVLEINEGELMEARKALSEAQARQEAIEKERDQILEELARSEAKRQEYVATVMHDEDLAITELEAAKSLFNQKLQESVEEKFNLESKLVLAKQDAVELAVQVEKIAEIAFQQATAHILEDAQLRVSAAETSAAEAAYQIEERIQNATEGTIVSIVEQAKDAIEKALSVAETASDHVSKAMALFMDTINPVDEIASIKSQNIKLRNAINDLESELLLKRNEVDSLKLELEQVCEQAGAFQHHANDVDKMPLEIQESSRKKAFQEEEEIESLLVKTKKDVAERRKAASKALKGELEAIKAAIEAAKRTARAKDEAYMRRCEALQRSLKALDATSKMWRQRAEMAESLLLRERPLGEVDEDTVYVVNGGRIDLLTDDDSQKWKLLCDGPRREIPDWMARRIHSICPKFPPRKIDVSEALTSTFKSLQLPKPDEVWSIAQEKPREGDTLIEHVIEKEFIEKKRKALERALQRKTVQWERMPEQTKLEPGTGTGREIVFQGFNWESWRKQWYLDLAPKAADLSQCGITAVWFPPPTESVAPQGDIFHAAPNIDHSQDFVRRDIKEWLNWLRNDIGFDGWRLDFVRGFSGGYVKEYIEASNPAFAIGEYWDSLAYEGGNLCYNQDAHRQRIVNWINATGGTSSAFDVTTKGILHSALHNQYWRLIDPQGKPTGVMGWWPSRAVTFLENHDTGSTQGHWPFPRDKLAQGYAYILTHPGTPVIFYDHFYDFGLRDIINELIEARRRAGVHCRSPVKIYHANDDGYVAQIGDTLVMKLGHFDWNPAKENDLDGSWLKFVDKGPDYQLWLRQ